MTTPSSPQVSRSYSYPLEAPWHSSNEMDPSRKGSMDSNHSQSVETDGDDKSTKNNNSSNSINNNDVVIANTNTSDKLVPPRLKHGKSPSEDVKKNRMWRASGTLVQQRLAAWKPELSLDLSHLNLDSIPKPILKGDHYLSLRELNLSSNKLSSLPHQINVLRLLVSLDCTFNRLSDLPVELGELHSLEHLSLSGNPLNKELMQKHLLGTGAVLQYLRDRQMMEGGRVRRSNKLPKSLRTNSEPSHTPPLQNTPSGNLSSSTPSLHPSSLNPSPSNSSISPLAISTDSFQNPLSSSDSSAYSASPSYPTLLQPSPHLQPPQTMQRQRSSPVPPPPPILNGPQNPHQTVTLNVPPSPVPPHVANGNNANNATPPSPTPETRGDMGPIVVQLKLGIIYAETVNKTPTIVSPVINVTATSTSSPNPSTTQTPTAQRSTLSPNDFPSAPKHRKTPSTNVDELANQLQNGSGKEKFTVHGDGKFIFNSYCSQSFLEVRNLSGVPQDRYLAALDSISALGFAGKSGAVLLKSADGLLVLKTISKDEAKFLRKIMPQYLSYIKANPKTYLTRFWGLYKVIRSPIEKASFVVMKNAFFTSKKIHERYDLKGSTVGRTTDEENVRRSRIVLKDLNFNRQLRLGEKRCQTFLLQLEKDTEFLQKFEIIDYSLIVGVHYLSEAPTRDPSQDYPVEGEIQAIDKDGQLLDEMYFLAIIDMLQPFNIRKQMEYNIKSIRYGPGISVVPPTNYANRFLSFIQSVIE